MMNYRLEEKYFENTYTMILKNDESPNLKLVGKCICSIEKDCIFFEYVNISIAYRKQNLLKYFIDLVKEFAIKNNMNTIKLVASPLEDKLTTDTLVSIYKKYGFVDCKNKNIMKYTF